MDSKIMKKSIYAKKPEGKEFEMIEPGNYMARCYSMIALGTHDAEYEGKTKRQQKVRITWEMPTELMENGLPFVIGKKYTLSMFESASLRKDLQSWRGKAFTEEEAECFDITNIIAVPCMLNIIHSEPNKQGKIYANIASISPLPKGMTCPPLINNEVIFTVDDFENTKELEKLPEFIQKDIKESLEYKGELGSDVPDIDIDALDPTDDIPFGL